MSASGPQLSLQHPRPHRCAGEYSSGDMLATIGPIRAVSCGRERTALAGPSGLLAALDAGWRSEDEPLSHPVTPVLDRLPRSPVRLPRFELDERDGARALPPPHPDEDLLHAFSSGAIPMTITCPPRLSGEMERTVMQRHGKGKRSWLSK